MKKSGRIYALINPLELRIFYIGSTQHSLEERLKNHISKAKSTTNQNEQLSFEINQILDKGSKPSIIELELFEFGKYHCFDLNDREADWIKSFKSQGFQLANSYSKKRPIKKGITGKMMKSYLPVKAETGLSEDEILVTENANA